MQLIGLVESADHVCCRYRLAAFRAYLEQAGHTLELRRLPRRWWSRLRLFSSLRGATVIVQRRLLPGWQISWLRRTVRHLLFDMDDAVFLRDSYSPRGIHHAGRLRRFAVTVRYCDAVIAGNAFLAQQAAQFAPAERIHIIPTCVDPTCYCPRWEKAKQRQAMQLVWVGSSSTLQGLQAVAPLLEEIGQRVPGVQLKLICDRFFALKHLPVVACPWSAQGEADAIACADVGISWVPDDQWSRGKCGLKVLQYMAAGLPVVANPVGVHTEMVRHGENGYLACSPGEWVAAVARLAGDSQLRVQMGRAGRRRLDADYSVEAGAQRWLHVLGHLQGTQARAS